jgi:hypothetical protein
MLNTLRLRIAGAAALITVTALTLSACASPSGTAATAKPTGTAVAGQEADGGCTESVPSADVMGLEQVTDDRGTYCHITWDLDSPNLAWDQVAVEASVEESGFTLDEAKAARDAALTHLVEDVLDSPFLDNLATDRADWLTERAPLMTEDTAAAYAGIIDDPKTVAENIVSFYVPPAPRDGTPRTDDIQFSGITIRGTPAGEAEWHPGGEAYLRVFSDVNVTFGRVSNADLVAAILRTHPEQTEDGLRAADPGLFDGADDGLRLEATQMSAYQRETGTRIVGTDINYRMFTASETPFEIAVIG